MAVFWSRAAREQECSVVRKFTTPQKGIWTDAGNLSVARKEPTLTVLNESRVLAVGGSNLFGRPFAVSDIFKVKQRTSSADPTPNEVRDDHTATLLQDGRVLIAGGSGNRGVILSSAELFSFRMR